MRYFAFAFAHLLGRAQSAGFPLEEFGGVAPELSFSKLCLVHRVGSGCIPPNHQPIVLSNCKLSLFCLMRAMCLKQQIHDFCSFSSHVLRKKQWPIWLVWWGGSGGPSLHLIIAQCAFWVVQWPSSQMAIAIKTLSQGKTLFLRQFFLYCFRKKTLKLVWLFIFRR